MIRSETLQRTQEVLNLIARTEEFKGAWRAFGTQASDRLSALRRVTGIESIGSWTRIEGRKLSDREVERLLSSLQIKSFAARDEQEVLFVGRNRPMLLKNPFTKPPLFALKAFFWIAAPIRGCKAGCLGHFIQFPVLRAQLAR